MNKNQIILTVLFMSLLLGQPLVAQEQSQATLTATPGRLPGAARPSLVDRAKKEYKEFREALKCVRQKGFRACSPAQKKRIIRDGVALLAVMAVVTYGGFRGASWWKTRKTLSRREAGEKEEKKILEPKGSEQERSEQEKKNASLFEAIESRDLAKVKDAINEGADVNVKDHWGRTPLYLAVLTGNQEVAELLISKGALVDAQSEGQTPLHVAVLIGPQKLVEFLISKRANMNAKDYKGQTPLDAARGESMKDFLISKGAKTGKELRQEEGAASK